MSGANPALEAYLSELAPLLTGRARRSRAVAEIRDHLSCEFEARLRDGQAAPDAAAAALSCVGDARMVAAGFAEARVRRTFARAERLTLICVLAFGALFLLSTQVANVRDHSAFSHGPAEAVGWIASQVAGTAMAIAWLRGRRLRSATGTDAGVLGLSLRAAAVAVGSAALTLGLDTAAVLGASQRTTDALGLSLAVVVGVTAVAGVSVGCAAVDARRLRRLGGGSGGAASALEDLHRAALGALERADALCEQRPGRVHTAIAGTAAAADSALTWALARRGRAAAVVGAAAGAAPALASLREHGLAGGARQALLAALAAGVLFTLEAGAVVVSVYLFDRLLRLWPSGYRQSRQPVTG